MENDQEIINRVDQSGIISLDLEAYYHQGERLVYDIKNNLFQELILKEKDFRDFIKEYDWSIYKGKNVAITCTADAIVPTWAYMLLTSKISLHANMVVFGDLLDLEQALYEEALRNIEIESFRDKRVVIKGCGKYPVPIYAYVKITNILQSVVQSLMYGEPCSTVPIFKRPKK